MFARQVSYTFSRDFISLLLKDVPAKDFGRTPVLVKALRRVCRYFLIDWTSDSEELT